MSGNKICMDLVAHQVVDRFFIKRCNKCQKFGHYQKDCTVEVHCGYCRQNPLSKDCNEIEDGDFAYYDCVNCERADKRSLGHSAYWHKCPTYLDLQKKAMKSSPYYNQKTLQVNSSSNSSCKIMCWNVWSMLNEDKRSNILQVLNDNQIQVACISETWFGFKKWYFYF